MSRLDYQMFHPNTRNCEELWFTPSNRTLATALTICGSNWDFSPKTPLQILKRLIPFIYRGRCIIGSKMGKLQRETPIF